MFCTGHLCRRVADGYCLLLFHSSMTRSSSSASSFGSGTYPSAEHAFCPDVSAHCSTRSSADFFAVSSMCRGVSSHVKVAKGYAPFSAGSGGPVIASPCAAAEFAATLRRYLHLLGMRKQVIVNPPSKDRRFHGDGPGLRHRSDPHPAPGGSIQSCLPDTHDQPRPSRNS